MMDDPNPSSSRFGIPSRLEAFSDGVFAIAITLLVLEIRPPTTAEQATSAELWVALAHLWPSYSAYLLAFLMILVTWVGHHVLIRQVERVDARLLFVNGLLLLTVSFLPFPTAVVAEHLRHASASAAVTFYVLANVVNSLAFMMLSRVALSLQDSDTGVQRRLSRNATIGFLGCLCCVGVAQLSPALTLVLIGVLWLSWLLSSLRSAPS